MAPFLFVTTVVQIFQLLGSPQHLKDMTSTSAEGGGPLLLKALTALRVFLAPLQLGYGTPHGSEAAVHAAHIYLQNLPSDHLLLKLDFKTAFNCLRHDRMLTVVRENVPELLPLVHSAYSSPSHLFIGDEII